MRILHISAQKPDSTGSGVYLNETVQSLHRQGYEQAVIAGIGPGDEPVFPERVLFCPVRFETDELPFPVVGMSNVMPYKATRYRDLTSEMTAQFKAAFTATLDDVLDRFLPDLVICHHLYLACSVIVRRIAQHAAENAALTHCIVCGLSHSTDIRQMRQIPLERDFIREGVRMLDRIYALHEAQAEEIVEVYGADPSRIRVVGTGYNARIFHEQPQLRHEGTANVVYAGKIYRKKGVESLIRSFAALCERMPEAHLVLAGGYNDLQEYEEIVQLARTLDIPADFVGRLSQEELAAEYSKADVFVLPSCFEGLPLVAIEALACGCKAVLTDLPGLKPWIEAYVEGGTIDFVEPPRMLDVDTPVEEDLPAFEERLAHALERSLHATCSPCDTSRVSWDALATRLL